MTFARLTRPRLSRETRPGERAVGWLELFYDLVYVAALIQVGRGLVADVSLAGGMRFLILFFLLWWAWTGTTFYMNRIAVDDVAHRLLVIIQMIAIAALGTEVGGAFEDQAGSVALAYGVVRTTIVLMYVRAWRLLPEVRTSAVRYSLMFGVSALIWFASVFVDGPARFWMWGVAIAIDAARVFKPDITDGSLQPDRDHMLERYALFTIIVLGESFIKTIGAVADHGVTLDTQILGAIGLAITAAMWWTYFDDVADSPIKSQSTSLAPTVGWVYAHFPLTMGLTSLGVAIEKLALSDLDEPVSSRYAMLMFVSLVVVLASISILDALTVNRHFAISEVDRLTPRISAIVVLAVVWLFSDQLTAPAFGVLVLLIVATQIGVQDAIAARRERAVVGRVDALVSEGRGEICEDFVDITFEAPRSGVCAVCEELGKVWVQLRSCAECGYVGCCDDSDGAHSRQHFSESGHPVMASIEDGAEWAWCYIHDTTLDLARQ